MPEDEKQGRIIPSWHINHWPCEGGHPGPSNPRAAEIHWARLVHRVMGNNSLFMPLACRAACYTAKVLKRVLKLLRNGRTQLSSTIIHWTLPIYKELVYKTLQFMRATRWVKHVPWPQSVYNLTERITSIPMVTMQQGRSNAIPSHLQECLPVIHITFNNSFPQTRSPVTYSQVGPF